ncbi:response regulator transcription factor [Luteimonas sp. A482]
MDTGTTIYVIDDDGEVRDALARLLRSLGHDVRAYPDADAFLLDGPPAAGGCLLLDINLPGMSGPQLHARMRALDLHLPVIYLTGQGSVSAGVRAMKDGALDFLEKPVDEAVLGAAIDRAITQQRDGWAVQRELDEINHCLATLSPREREVMDHVIAGRLNKQVAADLGIAEKTVKVHRGRVMQKMQVRSVAQLVRRCDAVGHCGWSPPLPAPMGSEGAPLGPILAGTRWA